MRLGFILSRKEKGAVIAPFDFININTCENSYYKI